MSQLSSPIAADQQHHPPTLLDEIAKLFDCSNAAVRHRLQSVANHQRALAAFDQKFLLTTYKDRSGKIRTLMFAGLTFIGAHKLYAHASLAFPFNSLLPQFFYDRHNITLKFPFHPVAVCKSGSDDNILEYYPLELVRLVPAPPDPPAMPAPLPPIPHERSVRNNRWYISTPSTITDEDEQEHAHERPITPYACTQLPSAVPTADARGYVLWMRNEDREWQREYVWLKPFLDSPPL